MSKNLSFKVAFVTFFNVGILFSHFTSFAQTQTFPIQNILIGKGQDINCIYHITQDRRGFLWLSTLYGLVRYDGYQFVNYNYERHPSLKGKRVNHVEEDKFGNLWVFAGQWLHVYNHLTDSIYTIKRLDISLSFYATLKIMNPIMTQDQEGTIWMRSRDGLYRIQPHQIPSKSKIEVIRYHTHDAVSSIKDEIRALLVDRNQQLWIGTNHGLYLFDKEANCISPSHVQIRTPINALFESEDGRIYIGTMGKGLQIYDPAKGQIFPFFPDDNDTTSLAGESIHQITSDGKNNIWLLVGSYESRKFSLQRFDPSSRRFVTYFRDQKAAGARADIGGICFRMFKDQKGQLWIVGKNGLLLFDPFTETLFEVQLRDNYLIDWSWIIATFVDRTGVVWMGTAPTGLLKYAPTTSKFEVMMPETDESTRGDFIFPIIEDSHGNLWRTTLKGTDRYIFDDKNNLIKEAHYSFKIISHMEGDQGFLWLNTSEGNLIFDYTTEQISSPPVSHRFNLPGPIVLKDDEGWLWLRTYGAGLIRFHPVTGITMRFQHEPEDSCTLLSNYITGNIIQDEERNIWIASSGGVNQYDPETQTFQAYLKGIPASDLHEDKSGRIWITTEGFGLFLLDKISGKTKRYSKKDGFPARRPLFILEDERGDLWISSDIGLIHFQPEKESWHLYNESDGLPTAVFAYGSCKSKNGKMFFPFWRGGMIYFHPDSLREDSFQPQTIFSDFKLNNNPVKIGVENSPLKTSIWTTDELILPYNQNIFTLGFSALHFASPEKNKYQYIVDGMDKDWNLLGNQRTVNFTGIQHGNYLLRVKAANHDGLWSEEKKLKITILPPWWITKWAYSVYILLFSFALWGLYLFLKRRWQLQAELAMEHHQAERLKELDQIKNKFYTNISHEFRTPLTIILGMAVNLKTHARNEMQQGLDMIVRNGESLLQLVNRMLDLSKLESGSLRPTMIQGDVIAYLKYLVESFYSLADSKGISLQFQSKQVDFVMDYDPEKLREIVSNLLSNAIKFTEEGGTVVFEANGGNEDFYLTIDDNGKGIHPDQLPLVFDRFFQVDDSSIQDAQGTGIGLALTREMVHLLGGTINVESTLEQGTTFSVILPISHNAPFSDYANKKDLAGAHKTIRVLKEKPEPIDTEMPILLLVEDNLDVIAYIKTILAQDYQIEVANHGEEGLEKAFKLIPDIIISDVMMPIMDGYTLSKQLKSDIRTNHIPVILLTARADMASRIEGLELGADVYMEKPFHKKELLVRVEMLLKSRKLLQARYSNPDWLPTEDTTVQKSDAFILKVRQILNEQLHNEDYSIADLCQEIGMSRSQFYRKFKSLTDQSIGNYFRSMRLQKAKELIQTTELQISMIAYEVGFKDPAYFTKTFKEEFGMSPSELRKA